MPKVKIVIISCKYTDVSCGFVERVKQDLQPTAMTVQGNHTFLTFKPSSGEDALELELVTLKNAKEFNEFNDAHSILYVIPKPTAECSLVDDVNGTDDMVFNSKIPTTTQAALVFLGNGKSLVENTFKNKLQRVFPNIMVLEDKNIGQAVFTFATSRVQPPMPHFERGIKHMPKHINIIIVGHPDDQINVVNTLLNRSFDVSAPLIHQANFQLGGQSLEIELRRTIKGVPTVLNDAHVLLYVLPGGEYLGDTLSNASNIIDELQRDYLTAPQSRLLPILLVGDFSENSKQAQQTFRTLTEKQYLLRRHSLEKIISEAIRNNHYTETPSPSQVLAPILAHIDPAATGTSSLTPSATTSSVVTASAETSKPEKSSPSIVNRFFGALFRITTGILVSAFVYNPVSSLFAALSGLQRDFSLRSLLGLEKTAIALGLVIVAPIWGPVKGIFYDGIYQQAKRGWQYGFAQSLRTFIEIPRDANLSNLGKRKKPSETTPISGRNIIAGIIISSLIVAAGLAVVLLPINAAIGISAYAAQYGLSSLTVWQLAVAAASLAFATSTFIYSLGVACNKLLHMGSKATEIYKPNYLSKFLGAVIGFVVGAATSLLVNNPIAFIYACFRQLIWRAAILGQGEKSAKLNLLERIILCPLLFIFLPVILPFYALIQEPFRQAGHGWVAGFFAILGYTENYRSAYADVVRDSEKGFKSEGRDIIASLVVTALVAGTVLAILVPPVSIFLGIPALITIAGLSGMAPWGLALLGAAATFIAASILYGVGSKLYDWSMSQSEEPNTSPVSPTGASSYAQMDAAGLSGLETVSTTSSTATDVLHADQYGRVIGDRHAASSDDVVLEPLLRTAGAPVPGLK